MKLVFLLAPTSTPARVAAACDAATGFVYFVSVAGVTGARTSLPADLGTKVMAVRKRSAVPVVVGFGVSTPAQARAVGKLADGVVVGSAIVQRIAEGGARKARASGCAGSWRRSRRRSNAEPRRRPWRGRGACEASGRPRARPGGDGAERR